MKIDIDHLTEEELIDLNHRIVERLKFLDQLKAHKDMLRFRVGERVAFNPDGRGSVYGVLTKYNRKTVSVLADDGRRWNVSPSFLRPVSKAGADGKGGTVIHLVKDE